ncbi:hypothetical protein CEXT_6811 [Caerostris extrusa]|uniref:Uncharacterized protein n=1 Tax=Caerostris extrusa TaxID=172846 RepID=A0AAV4XI27_CAEEX|nr:hypothetical protein CEXT_6811 [Caerostris extrusa]
MRDNDELKAPLTKLRSCQVGGSIFLVHFWNQLRADLKNERDAGAAAIVGCHCEGPSPLAFESLFLKEPTSAVGTFRNWAPKIVASRTELLILSGRPLGSPRAEGMEPRMCLEPAGLSRRPVSADSTRKAVISTNISDGVEPQFFLLATYFNTEPQVVHVYDPTRHKACVKRDEQSERNDQRLKSLSNQKQKELKKKASVSFRPTDAANGRARGRGAARNSSCKAAIANRRPTSRDGRCLSRRLSPQSLFQSVFSSACR